MIAFLLQFHDALILAVWTILFVGIGAVCMWLWCHWRWYEGIMLQIAREQMRELFGRKKK